MLKINDSAEIDPLLGEHMVCILFLREGSLRSSVMHKIVQEVCKKKGYTYVYADASISKLFKLVSKLDVEVLPTCVFLNKGIEVYRVIGTESKYNIDRQLKNLEV